MSVEVPVISGKTPLNISINVMSTEHKQRVVITAATDFSQTWTGTGNETLATFDLERPKEATYKVQINNEVKGEWKSSKVELVKPELSQHLGTYYVLGYDTTNETEPQVSLVFTWINS